MQTCHTMCVQQLGSMEASHEQCVDAGPNSPFVCFDESPEYVHHVHILQPQTSGAFCLSIMCLILHSTSAEHTSSIVLSKEIKLSNKLAASFKSPLLTAVMSGGSFVAPCVPSFVKCVCAWQWRVVCHRNAHGV